MSSTTAIQAQLPLTEVTYLILLSLAPGARHGYAIMKDVEFMSQGRVVLSTGTLYGALPRLLEAGWIEPADDPQAGETGRVRKLYALTNLGQQVLVAEVERLDDLVAAARRRVFGRRAGQG